ncbi:MAG: Qat anti-phage system associated protein QatB [Verrucomicrobiota bacterium]
MGTSAGSKGPGSGVPFDPPWLDDLAPESDMDVTGGDDSPDDDEQIPKDDGANPDELQLSPVIAPPKRFSQARSTLTAYSKEPSRDGFRKAMGHYSEKGMGGARNLATRMRVSTDSGARVATFLKDVSENSEKLRDWVKEIKSRDLNPNQLRDLFVQQICPTQGSKEEESCRASLADALSEFLENNPDSDMMSLTDDEIREITKSYIAAEAFSRVYNDIGQIFERLSASDSVELTEEIRDYLNEDISSEIDRLWKEHTAPSQSDLSKLLSLAIERTFKVYEEEI